MTTIIKLKKKGVPGSDPTPSDLEHGELAINYADGKIYYKNSSNAIAQFLDSGQIVSMIDSAYIDDRINSLYLDSAEAIALVDSDYVQARIDKPTIDALNVDADTLDSLNSTQFLRADSATTFTGGILTLSSATPEIHFNGNPGSDPGVDMAIKATPEGLDFYEPEQSDRIHFQIIDDQGVNAPFGMKVGTAVVFHESNYESYIDSAYVNARLDTTSFLDSAEAHNILDSMFGNIDQHIVPIANEVYDLGDSTRKFRDLYLSGTSINLGNLVMSEHTGRVRFTNHTTGQEVKLAASNINQHLIDSTAILDLIDDNYLESNLQALNYLDSQQINDRIDIFIDSAVLAILDSSFYLDSAMAKDLFSVSGNVLTYDSSTGQFGTQTGDYLYSKTRFDSDFNAKSTTQLSEGTNQYYLKTRVDSDIDARVTGSFVDQLSITADDTTLFRGQDSAYYLDYNNFTSTPFVLDSSMIKNLFSVTGSALTYNSSTGLFGFVQGSTDSVSEGSTNLYFTDQRAIDAIESAGLDMGSNNIVTTGKVLFANMYSAEANLPNANTYHGMFAHVHATGKGYFAHNGNWIKLLDETSSTTTNLTEGSRLYYTTGRFDSDFGDMTTTNLTEGNNLYYTTARADSDIGVKVTKTLVDNLGINATQLNGQAGGHYLDYVNFTNTPNVLDSTNVKNIFSVGGGVLAYDAGTGTFSTVTNALYRTVDFDSDLGTSTTDNLSEGSTNLYYTSGRADSDGRNAISVSNASGDGSLAYAPATGIITYTGPSAAETRAHFTGGNGISIASGVISTDSSANVEFGQLAINGRGIYGGNYGAVNINKNNTLGDSTASVLGYTSDDSSRNAVFNLAIDNQYNANIGLTLNNEFIFGTQNADVTYKFVKSTGVNPIDFANPNTLFEIQPSGNSKFYSGTDATTKTSASLVLVGGLGVDKTIRSNDIVVVNNVQAGTNGTGKFIGNVDGTVDDISNHTTTALAEGTNLYYTTARFDSDLGASSTTDLSEGSNLYYTVARADSAAKNAISVNDAGGDGSLSYAPATGILTYTGPSATEVRSHFTAGTGVTINSGQVAIGQAVSTTDSVEFGGGLFTGDVTIQGDLTITGTQSAQAQADLSVSNAYIVVADSNLQDNVDIGIVGQYSDDGGTTKRHTGFVRDASNGEWYVFDNLVQDNIDSSPRAQTLNLSDSSVNLPTWNFGALRGQYLGFDSDFTQYSTNYQVKESDFSAVTANRYAVDTTDGQVVCTLPASPSTGDYVKLIDISNWSGTNTVILSRNGSTIEGYTDNFELDLGQSIIELIYINNTWNIYSSIGQRGPQGEKGDSADVANFATKSEAIAFAIGLG